MRKPSAPLVVSFLALFLALAGTGLAAKHYLITSTSQIKPSVLHYLHGREGAEGAQGLPGPQGPPGPAGSAALSGLTTVAGPKNFVANEEAGSSLATCPAGQHAVSGGAAAITIYGLAVTDMTEDHTGWFAIALGSGTTASIQAYVNCAAAGAAVAARAGSHARVLAHIAALTAAVQAEAHRPR